MANRTIKYYNDNAVSYYTSTVSLDMSEIYKPFLKHLNPGSKVLDAGCGSGRDSYFFKNSGYEVTAFDASEEMVKLSSQLLGQKVYLMTFEELALDQRFDGIWACASLLHVTRATLLDTMRVLTKKLKPGGVFYASFKYGTEEFWHDGRYFNCLNENSLQSLLAELPDLKIEKLHITLDVREKQANERWLNGYFLKV